MSTGHCVQFGFLVGPPGDLSAALHIVESCSSVALHLKLTEASPSCLSCKAAMSLSPHCHLRSLSPVRGSLSWAALLAFPPSLKRCSRVGLPSGSLGLLHEMGNSHVVATLLRSCFALPKFSYVIRPPTSARPVGMSTVPSERLLESILGGGPLTDWSWLKASLTSSRGGFQPAECLAPCPCRFPGIFLALPDASGENAGT